jgi:hypothetical protein
LVAHDLAQVARQVGLGIVDRLVLADQAAHLAEDLAGPGFLDGIRQALGRVGGGAGETSNRR